MAEMRQGIRVPENGYSETSVAFMDKVMEISGLGDKTFLPASARHPLALSFQATRPFLPASA